MIYATPGSSIEATLSGAPTGLTGTLGVRILDNTGGTTLARQTSGISEFPAGSGFYSVTLGAPATAGQYTVMWDTGSVTPSTTFTDDLVVAALPFGSGTSSIKGTVARSAIPYVNAMLTAITNVGSTPDYDDPGTPGGDRWTGAQGIYVAEEIIETLSPGRVDEVKQTRIEIPYGVGKLVQRGDTLTYTYEAASQQRKAGTISHAPLVGRVRVLVENG